MEGAGKAWHGDKTYATGPSHHSLHIVAIIKKWVTNENSAYPQDGCFSHSDHDVSLNAPCSYLDTGACSVIIVLTGSSSCSSPYYVLGHRSSLGCFPLDVHRACTLPLLANLSLENCYFSRFKNKKHSSSLCSRKASILFGLIPCPSSPPVPSSAQTSPGRACLLAQLLMVFLWPKVVVQRPGGRTFFHGREPSACWAWLFKRAPESLSPRPRDWGTCLIIVHSRPENVCEVSSR